MSALNLPLPSKRARSTSARDLRYGRQGGRWAPLQTDHEQAESFAAAIEAGDIVNVQCGCGRAWIAKRDVGRPCKACDQPMREPGAPPPDPPDPAGAAKSALTAARRILAPPLEHPAGCRCSEWCRNEWTFAEHGAPAFGPCDGCGEPCRSIDPRGVQRHPTCGAVA